MAELKGYPPVVNVGKGGPPPTSIAHDLRKERDAVHTRISQLVVKLKTIPEKERETLNNTMSVLVAEAHRLSQQILLSERRPEGNA